MGKALAYRRRSGGEVLHLRLQVRTTLAMLFDQLGGIDHLVRGKTVAVKINVTGSPPRVLPPLAHR